jgi:asparagine synthase (glutamine-hydrolysing)
MSVQFGMWNQDGQPVDEDHFEKAKELLAPYGPDRCDSYREANVAINYQALHTTSESRREKLPHTSCAGSVITWDGRLDNRPELRSLCDQCVSTDATDVEIVAAAYEKWGAECFGKLVGDWALSIWNPANRLLILAKDPIGTRHLYYTFEKDQVIWSTILDPLVLLAGKSFAVEEEYIAGWLSSFPATHLTPYVGIHAVPPSSFVSIRPGKRKVSKYWDFDPGKRVRYNTDAEYEEHFRTVFRQSVRCRLRSDSPVLAELSGGMDSSSIVCMADSILASGLADTPQIDTISCYNDSEPNWNERPYFTQVEDKRGRVGRHIDVGSQDLLNFASESERFEAVPGSLSRGVNKSQDQFIDCVISQGNRVILSGIGGDEVTGGVPTPAPEIEDLFIGAYFGVLAHRLKIWALSKRKPWFYLLLEAATHFLPPALVGVRKNKKPIAWLRPEFVKRNRAALQGYPTRLKVLGPLPSFQENLLTLNGLRRQLECCPLSAQPPHERRYPFLDRDLLEFLFSVPREQLLRPGQRRSLMRRALKGLVPDGILNRKRKAFVARAPILSVCAARTNLTKTREPMISSSLGIVDANRFCEFLEEASRGQEVPIVFLMRTLVVESWLRAAQNHIKTSPTVLKLARDSTSAAQTNVCPGKSSAS